MHSLVTDALVDLVNAAESLRPGDRQKADFAVSRLIWHLEPSAQMRVLSPWLTSTREYRQNTVMRSLNRQTDMSPWADFAVDCFRRNRTIESLKIIAGSPAASALIDHTELQDYFTTYITQFRGRPKYPDKLAKYEAMIAGRVLVVGGRSIPSDLLALVPEIFSWAIEQIGDPAYEAMLVWLVGEHPDNPEVLWSAVHTANRHFMQRALEKALEAARQLLLQEEHVLVFPAGPANKKEP